MKKTIFEQPPGAGIPARFPAENRPAAFPAIFIIAAGALLALGLLSVLLLALFSGGSNNGIALDGKPGGIAIIPLKGEISNDGGGSFGGPLTADEIVEMIDDAEKNSDVGAILMDIDSPGGEVIASKQIVYRIRDSKKPVYSYISSTGASGAYYVAASTSHIMADRDSITGSIGVISVVPNVEGLLEKIGVKMNVLKKGEHKDIGSPFKEMTESDRAIFQSVLTQIFENFKQDVFTFRSGKITRASLERIADGRILSGKQAYDTGLVDELVLTRAKAVSRAGELAGINDPHEVPYGVREFGFSDLLFSAGESFGSGFVKSLSVSSQGAAGSLQLR